MEYTHRCIKCGAQYKTDDPDAYLCEKDMKEKREIASKVDALMATKGSTRSAPSFEERIAALPKIPGTNIPFIQ